METIVTRLDFLYRKVINLLLDDGWHDHSLGTDWVSGSRHLDTFTLIANENFIIFRVNEEELLKYPTKEVTFKQFVDDYKQLNI